MTAATYNYQPVLQSLVDAVRASNGKDWTDYIAVALTALSLVLIGWTAVASHRMAVASHRMKDAAEKQAEASLAMMDAANQQTELALLPIVVIDWMPHETHMNERQMMYRNVGNAPAFVVRVNGIRHDSHKWAFDTVDVLPAGATAATGIFGEDPDWPYLIRTDNEVMRHLSGEPLPAATSLLITYKNANGTAYATDMSLYSLDASALSFAFERRYRMEASSKETPSRT